MKHSSANIYFHHPYKNSYLKERTRLKRFLVYVFKNEKTIFQQLDYVFCSDKYLLSLNQTHLNHNTYTDILTFNLAELDNPVRGEVYISLDRVRENAALFQNPYYIELHRVIIHGVLHLCGYLDLSNSEKKIMQGKEDFYLSKYFVSRETI